MGSVTGFETGSVVLHRSTAVVKGELPMLGPYVLLYIYTPGKCIKVMNTVSMPFVSLHSFFGSLICPTVSKNVSHLTGKLNVNTSKEK